MAECIADWMEVEGLIGVQFEDNLGSHKTDMSVAAWKTLLSMFHLPRYYPANLTGVVQPIDRHIGIIFKRAVKIRFKWIMITGMVIMISTDNKRFTSSYVRVLQQTTTNFFVRVLQQRTTTLDSC